MGFDFNFLDDNALIIDRQHLLRDPAYLWQAFREDAFRSPGAKFYYRPLLTLSFCWDAWWGGARPFAYRLSNLLLHLACGGLFFRLLLRLQAARGWAWFAAAVFIAHPAFALMPGLLSARNDSLLGLWLIPSFLAFLRYQEARKPAWALVHLGLWGLCLLTKETGAILPLLCLTYGRLNNQPAPRAVLIGWVLIGLPWLWIRNSVLGAGAGQAEEVLSTLPSNLPAFMGFLGRAFIPLNLSTYPLMDPAKLWVGVLAASILVVLFYKTEGPARRLAVFGWIWFALLMLPALAKPRDLWSRHDILESRLYLPFMGLGIALSGVDWVRLSGLSRQALGAAGFSVVALFSWLSFAQSAHYRDRLTFWKNATETSPESAFAGNNLGAMFFLDGNLAQAESEWRRTLKVNPHERLAHGNLGLVLMRRQAWEEAEQELLIEQRLNPRYDHVHFNLGLLYYSRGRPAEGLRLWEKTLELNPDYADAYAQILVHYYNARDIRKIDEFWSRARSRGLPLPPQLSTALERALTRQRGNP